MGSNMNPTPEQIDRLAFNLGSMGVKVPARDTAFFQAIVRQWLEEIGKANAHSAPEQS